MKFVTLSSSIHFDTSERNISTTSSSSHLGYLKDIHYHFDISSRCTSTHTVTQIGLRTSSHGSPPQAQSHQYWEYLLHSTAGTTIHSRYIISRSRTLCHRPRHQRQLTHLPTTSRTSTTSASGRPSTSACNIETRYNLDNSFSTSPSWADNI